MSSNLCWVVTLWGRDLETLAWVIWVLHRISRQWSVQILTRGNTAWNHEWSETFKTAVTILEYEYQSSTVLHLTIMASLFTIILKPVSTPSHTMMVLRTWFVSIIFTNLKGQPCIPRSWHQPNSSQELILLWGQLTSGKKTK